ncbi:MAG: hypothetical protein K1X64_17395 [Myxococcaceae bacterium]|nr:hypothetical protein [Myxococcaceae bacterium]
MRNLFAIAVVVFSVASGAQAQDDKEARKVAETYLNALSGAGNEAGKDLLLGGVTMTAQLFTLENWEIKAKDAAKKEELDLTHAVQLMNDLDKAGRSALTKLLGTQQVGDDLKVHELSAAEAQKLLEPTRDRARKFLKDHPVLAYVMRVDKEVYWHPKNPMRAILAKAAGSGKYTLEMHRWVVTTKEGPRHEAREWPLRVVRFKAGKLDTGWKVLPASDWNAE